MKTGKRLVSMLLVLSMLLSFLPSIVFAADTNAPEREKLVKFSGQYTSGGVTVSASAPAGVFPEGTRMTAKQVASFTATAEKIDDAVAEVREDDRSVADSHTFDITFYDKTGAEIEPNTAYGNVSVSFSLANADERNLTAEVYHVCRNEADGTLSAETVAAEQSGKRVTVQAESFSYYVVQFTYSASEYRYANYEAIKAEELLHQVGIQFDETSDEILDTAGGVVVSDESVLNAWYSAGVYGETEDEEGYEGWILEPVGNGTATVTVTVDPANSPDYVVYDIAVAVALRSDERVSEQEPTGYYAMDIPGGTGAYVPASAAPDCPEELLGEKTVSVKQGSDEARKRFELYLTQQNKSMTVAFRSLVSVFKKKLNTRTWDSACSQMASVLNLKGGKFLELNAVEIPDVTDVVTDIPSPSVLTRLAGTDGAYAYYTYLRNLKYMGEQQEPYLQVYPYAMLLQADEPLELQVRFKDGWMLYNYGIFNENQYICDPTMTEEELQTLRDELDMPHLQNFYQFSGEGKYCVYIGLVFCDENYNCGFLPCCQSDVITVQYTSGGGIIFSSVYEAASGKPLDLTTLISGMDNKGNPLTFEPEYSTISYRNGDGDKVDPYSDYLTDPLYEADPYAAEQALLEDLFTYQPERDPMNLGYVEYTLRFYCVETDGVFPIRLLVYKEYPRQYYLFPYDDLTPELMQQLALYSNSKTDKLLQLEKSLRYSTADVTVLTEAADAELGNRYSAGLEPKSVSELLPHLFTETGKKGDVFEQLKDYVYGYDGAEFYPVEPDCIDLEYCEDYWSGEDYDAPLDWGEDEDSDYFSANYAEFEGKLSVDETGNGNAQDIFFNMYLYRPVEEMYFSCIDPIYLSEGNASVIRYGDYLAEQAYQSGSFTPIPFLETKGSKEDVYTVTLGDKLDPIYLAYEMLTGADPKIFAPEGDYYSETALQYSRYYNFDHTSTQVKEKESLKEKGKNENAQILPDAQNDPTGRITSVTLPEWTLASGQAAGFGVYRQASSYYSRSYDEAGSEQSNFGTVNELEFVVTGALDINRVGSYHLVFTPVVNGIAEEDLAIRLHVLVSEQSKWEIDLDVYDDEGIINLLKDSAANFLANPGRYASAYTESGNRLEVKALLSGGKDKNGDDKVYSAEKPTQADILANIAEGDTYTITFSAVHPKNSSIFVRKTSTLKIVETMVEFEGTEDLEVGVGVLASTQALLYGVSAHTEQNPISGVRTLPVTIQQTNVEPDVPGSYTVTYAAVHPDTGVTFTRTRNITVSSNAPAAVLTLELSSGNSGVPDDDPEKFILGASGQDRITLLMDMDAKSETVGSVTVHLPAGFELSGSASQLQFTGNSGYGRMLDDRSYEISFAVGAGTTAGSVSITVQPDLTYLYQELANGYDEYGFYAQCYDENGKPIGDCTGTRLTLSANTQLQDTGFTVTAGEQTFTPNELFSAFYMNRYPTDSQYNYRGTMIPNNFSEQKGYTISISKDKGKLLSPYAMLYYQLPEGLEPANCSYYPEGNPAWSGDTSIYQFSYPAYMIFRDEEGEPFAYKPIAYDGSWLTKNGITEGIYSEVNHLLPLFDIESFKSFSFVKDSTVQYTFAQVRPIGIQPGMTYLDAMRKASTIDVELRFSPAKSDLSKLKINLPGQIEGEGAMAGGKASLFFWDADAAASNEKPDMAATSAEPVSIKLVNPDAVLDLVYDDYNQATNSIPRILSALSVSGIDRWASGLADEDDSAYIGGGNMAEQEIVLDLYDKGLRDAASYAGSHTEEKAGNADALRNLEVTAEYPYEYSPVSFTIHEDDIEHFLRSGLYYECWYTVSDSTGVLRTVKAQSVFDTLKYSDTLSTLHDETKSNYSAWASSYNSQMNKTLRELQELSAEKDRLALVTDFEVDAARGEYVSKLAFRFKTKDGNVILPYHWIKQPGTFYYWQDIEKINVDAILNNLSVQIAAKTIDEDKTVSVKISAKDDHYTLKEYVQTVQIAATDDEMDVNAGDFSGYQLAVGPSQGWNGSIQVSFGVNSKTPKYRNPHLTIAGEAVSLINFKATGAYDHGIGLENGSGSPAVIGYTTAALDRICGDLTDTSLWITGDAATEAWKKGFADVTEPITGIIVDMSDVTFDGTGAQEDIETYLSFAMVPLWKTSPHFDIIADRLAETGSCALSFMIDFRSDTGSASTQFPIGRTRTITRGNTIDTIIQRSSDYVLDPFAGSDDILELDKMELICVQQREQSPEDSYYGAHQSLRTVFTAENTEKSRAFLSLVQGVSIDHGIIGNPVMKIEYETMLNGKASVKEAGMNYRDSGYTQYYKRTLPEAHSYGLYAAFDLQTGEYVTKVTIYWNDDITGNYGFPYVGLVRVSQVPKTSLTGYSFTQDEQGEIRVESIFTKWPSTETTTLGATVTTSRLDLNPPTAKLCGYDPTAAYAVSSEKKQGEQVTVTLGGYIHFTHDSYRIGSPKNGFSANSSGAGDPNYLRLRHTVYYRLDSNFEYAGCDDSQKAAVTYTPNFFTDGDGLLTVAYNDYYDNYGIQVKLAIGYNKSGLCTPVKEAYLDAGYDVEHSLADRGYRIAYSDEPGTAAVFPELFVEKLSIAEGTKCIPADINTTLTLGVQNEDAFDVKPILYSGGESVRGSAGGSLSSTTANTFGFYMKSINTHTESDKLDWNIYIPISKAGKTAPGTVEAAQFSLKMTGPVVLTGYPEGSKVTYTTSESLSFNGLNRGAADGADFVEANAVSEWGNVTAVHITIPKTTRTEPFELTIPFAEMEKKEAGEQKAYITALYNYRIGDVWEAQNRSADYLLGTTSTLTLEDYHISGKVWRDDSHDGVMGFDEPGVEGVTVSVAKAADNSEVDSTTSASDGTYTLGVPEIGEYVLHIDKYQDENDLTKAMDVAVQPGTSVSVSSRNLADPENGTTGTLSITAANATIAGEALQYHDDKVSGVNLGMVPIEMKATAFSYGCERGELSAEAAVTLAFAVCTDRTGEPAKITVNAEDLSAINEAIENDKPGKLPLTFSYTASGEPGIMVKKTVFVYLRGNGTDIPNNADYITAEDFSAPISKNLTLSTARKLSFVSAIDPNGEPYAASKIKLKDQSQLAAINDAIAEEKVGSRFELTFVTPGNADAGIEKAEVTVTVTLSDSTVKKGKLSGTPYLTAKPITMELRDASLADGMSSEQFFALSGVKAIDTDGYVLTEGVALLPETLDKLNAAIASMKPGTYRVLVQAEYLDALGESNTVNMKVPVTLKDSFYLALDGNGSTSGSMTRVKVDYDTSVTLAKNTYKRTDYVFSGWAVGSSATALYLDEVTLPKSVINKFYDSVKNEPTGADSYPTKTLYAAWEALPGEAKVDFTVIPNEKMPEGTSLSVTVNILRDGIEVAKSRNGTVAPDLVFSGCFEDLDAGTYCVVVSYGKSKDSRTVSVSRTGSAAVEFTTVVGDLRYEVKSEGTAPKISVDGLDQLVDDALMAEIASGSKGVTLTVVASEIAAEDAPIREKMSEAMKKAVNEEAEFDSLMDLQVLQTIREYDEAGVPLGDPVTKPIEETEQVIRISIPYSIPEGMKAKPYVFRYHGSEVQKLTNSSKTEDGNFSYTTLDETHGVITLYSQKFSMYAVALELSENKTPTGGVGGGSDELPVEAPQETPNGTVTVSPKKAMPGQTVVITTKPDEGYELDEIKVIDEDGSEVSLTDLGGGKYSFRMPDKAVKVSVTYKKLGKAECPKDSTCPLDRFDDTANDGWWHDGIHYCVENGLMTGVRSNQFSPRGTTTRAMIVTILWRMEGEPVVDHAMSFTDVLPDMWYTEAIRWAQSTGIVKGYDAKTFGTYDAVTREQLSLILYRYAQSKGEGFTGSWMFLLDFDDIDQIHAWADEAVHWCSMNGIVKGKENNLFDPRGNATRAEVATMIQRFCER